VNRHPYTETLRFPDALKAWTGKPLNSTPADRAPCGYLVGCADENRVLADVFARLCALDTLTARTTYLLAVIERSRRHVRLAESTIRGEANPRRVGAEASREAWARLRPMEAMIEVLEQWRDELLELWDGEIGVQFIEDAARRAS
jgi:hypothetical protein